MGKRRAYFLILTVASLFVAGTLVVLASWREQRHPLARLTRRFCLGEPLAVQRANDLANDVNKEITLDTLRSWGRDTLARYRAKTLVTAGSSPYWSQGHITLAGQEIPEFIKRTWREQPDVSIRLRHTGRPECPECVAVSWYLHGLSVGDANYLPTQDYWYLRAPEPGIYVYHRYR